MFVNLRETNASRPLFPNSHADVHAYVSSLTQYSVLVSSCKLDSNEWKSSEYFQWRRATLIISFQFLSSAINLGQKNGETVRGVTHATRHQWTIPGRCPPGDGRNEHT